MTKPALLALLLSLLAPIAAAQPPAPDPALEDDPIVVTGIRNVVVDGRARPCVPLRNDPIDRVDVTPPHGPPGVLRQSSIIPDGRHHWAFGPGLETITGPVFWQRAGTGIDQYRFRAPADGTPLCIGARGVEPVGFGQLVRITDAAPYRGRRIRFTAWAATGDARLVRFWLAAGTGWRRLYNGGNTNNQPWGGNHGWTPILLEIGPVDPRAEHISYGFLLYGQGDVWVYNPKLEIIDPNEPGARTGDVAVIGPRGH